LHFVFVLFYENVTSTIIIKKLDFHIKKICIKFKHINNNKIFIWVEIGLELEKHQKMLKNTTGPRGARAPTRWLFHQS
jgi:hypothetical protein